MAMSTEHRSKFYSPYPAMMTSPNEWKILEWDEKLQTNKTKNSKYTKQAYKNQISNSLEIFFLDFSSPFVIIYFIWNKIQVNMVVKNKLKLGSKTLSYRRNTK